MNRQSIVLAIGIVLFCVAGQSRILQAQDPYSCIDGLSDDEVEVRLNWLDNSFQSGKRHARGWWYSWIAIMATVTIGQVIWAVSATEQKAKVSNTVGAIGAGLLTIQLSVFTQAAAYAPNRFRDHPDSTTEERKKKLRYGLGLLKKAARQQRQGRGAFPHLSGVVWSAVNAPLMQHFFNDWGTTLRLILGGISITQLRIWTQPMAAAKAWDRIRHFNCSVHASEARRRQKALNPTKENVASLRYTGTNLQYRW